MRGLIGKAAALLLAAVLGSQVAFAGTPVGSAFANGDSAITRTLLPGQTFTVTVNFNFSGAAGALTLNQIGLDPNVASQFQIVGGTCNTTTTYGATSTCTVIVKFIGNQAGTATADLKMGCTALAAAGGFQIRCDLGRSPGVVGTMARFVGNGVAAAVDALGREGLTLLAAALFAMTAFLTLRRRA